VEGQREDGAVSGLCVGDTITSLDWGFDLYVNGELRGPPVQIREGDALRIRQRFPSPVPCARYRMTFRRPTPKERTER
jgi:hypothetical protein